MKIAVSSTGKELISQMDTRFGRADYFLIVDLDTMAYEVVENTQNLNLPQGAGIQAGKTVAEKHVDAVITGNCGPKAFKVLQASGVRVVVGAAGRVIDVIERFKKGEFEFAGSANVEGHWV